VSEIESTDACEREQARQGGLLELTCAFCAASFRGMFQVAGQVCDEIVVSLIENTPFLVV
jgi:hypothetical protein